MEFAIMIEGQDGLNWPRWQRLAQTVEELGFAGLYRSDHYINLEPPEIDSLEAWVSLTWLASHTQRIEFGPLVSPFSFREPTMLARMAAAVDDLSGGRLRLGVGAGWMEREHHNYGWDLLEPRARFDRLEEGLHILTHLLRRPEPLKFYGEYFQVNDAVLLPRPQRPGGPPVVIGGNGKNRTLPLAARYADEWNGVFITPDEFAALNARLDGLLEQAGRSPGQVRRTLMTGLEFASTPAELETKIRARTREKHDRTWLQEQGVIAGTPEEIPAQLEAYARAGVERIMLQWLEQDNLDGLSLLADTLRASFT